MRLPLLFPLFLLSGCVTSPSYQPGQLSRPAEMPDYRTGDTFLFSDGRVEKVMAVFGDRIDWESRGGDFRYSTYPNFILPKRSWETEKKQVNVEYSGDKGLLWPLQSGDSAYVSTVVTVTSKPSMGSKSYLQSWRCETGDVYQIHVAAGDFDAQKIQCQRYTLMGRWMQTRTWYYAPAVGHYVLQQDEYAPTSSRRHTQRSRELVAVIPSEQHLLTTEGQSAGDHFQQTMETLVAGESSEWRDEGDRYSRTVTPLRSFRTPDQRYCREYQTVRRDDGRIQHYRGTACRSEDGAWRIAVARPEVGGGE